MAFSSHGAPGNPAQETRYGGREAVEMTEMQHRTYYSHSATANASFHPHRESLDTSDARTSNSKPPGQIPWQTFLQGSIVLIVLSVCGIIRLAYDAHHHFSAELEAVDPSAEALVAAPTSGARLVFGGPWPHPFLRPRGLACHPALGSAVLLAESYAVHELAIDDTSPMRAAGVRVRPALSECLGQAPDFLAGGLRAISLHCGTPPQGEEGGDDCVATLLGSAGHEALQCALRPGMGSAAERLRLYGGPWRSLAVGPSSTFWAVKDGHDAIVQLQPRPGTIKELLPEISVPHGAARNLTQMHVHGDAVVYGLAATGRLHGWPLDGSAVRSWQAPRGRRLDGLCSTRDRLYFAGTDLTDGAAKIWRSALPSELHH